MATRVTSKLQVTIPKAIARRYGIAPGQEIDWLEAGDAIRVVPQSPPRQTPNPSARLEMFDRASARQLERQSRRPVNAAKSKDRGWTREELYERGHPG
jgi:AbrB family looped-hinge helix DNA binding protein